MDEKQFEQLLEELMSNIDDGPFSNTEMSAQIANKHLPTNQSLKVHDFIHEINDSLGTIRIIIKYLLFDIEATRRERDELRMLLEDQD